MHVKHDVQTGGLIPSTSSRHKGRPPETSRTKRRGDVSTPREQQCPEYKYRILSWCFYKRLRCDSIIHALNESNDTTHYSQTASGNDALKFFNDNFPQILHRPSPPLNPSRAGDARSRSGDAAAIPRCTRGKIRGSIDPGSAFRERENVRNTTNRNSLTKAPTQHLPPSKTPTKRRKGNGVDPIPSVANSRVILLKKFPLYSVPKNGVPQYMPIYVITPPHVSFATRRFASFYKFTTRTRKAWER